MLYYMRMHAWFSVSSADACLVHQELMVLTCMCGSSAGYIYSTAGARPWPEGMHMANYIYTYMYKHMQSNV